MQNKKKVKRRMITVTIGIVFLLFSLMILYPLITCFVDSHISQKWSKVECDIVYSKIKTRYESSGKGGRAKSYSLDLKYKYVYNDKQYIGTRYSFCNKTGFLSEIKKINMHITNTTKSFCYVNPQAPDEAVLCRDIKWFWIFTPMLIAIFFILAGILLIIV